MAISSAHYAKIKTLIYKCTLYAIALFIIATAQVTFFGKINLLGATPDLLLAAIAALSVKEDHKVVAICGIISGFLYCSLGGAEYPLYILFSFVCSYTLKIIALRSFGTNFISFFALSIIAFLAKGLFNLFDAAIFSSTFVLFRVLFSIVIPELISSVALGFVSYLIISVISKSVNRKVRKGEIKK